MGVRPSFSCFRLRQQGDGQVNHLLHLLLQQLGDFFALGFGTLHDQFVVDLQDKPPL